MNEYDDSKPESIIIENAADLEFQKTNENS